MNSYGVRQFDKVQLRAIAIGKQYDKKAPSALAIADDMNLDRDLFVERDTHIVRNLFVGKGTGSESIGRVNVIGELSVSGNTFLGTNVQTTTVRNEIIVQDTLSVAGSVTVASCQNELPSNFMEFTRTRHANDDNIHVAIQEGDSLGSILFKGSDGTDWKKYVDIQTLATSTDLGNEGGKIQFNVISGGGPHSGDDGTNNIASYNTLFSIGGENKANSQNNEVVVNEAGINTDFRVKTDQKENMFFVDSLANKIGIDLVNPQFTLDIHGDINISNRSYVGGIEYKGGQVKRDSVTSNIESVNFIEGKLGIGTLNPDYDVDITGILNVRNKIITKDLVVKGSTSLLPDTNNNDPASASHALVLTGTTYTDVMTTSLNRTQFSIENTSGQSINVGVLTNGKSMIQVVDNDTVPNFNSLSMQPLGGKIAIGKENPNVILDIGGNDSIKIPVGNTSERPTANSINELGYIRYNSELKRFEGYGQNHNQASATNEWISLSGLKDTDNDTYITVEDQNNSDNDQIKFFVEGRQELTLDKSGYLGIGVTSPNARLHIESNDANYNSEPLAIFKSQNKDASIRVEGKGETYLEIANVDTTGDTNNSWGIGMNDDKNLYFNWKTNGTINYDTNINERNAMTIMQNGNVGINKANPNITFDIEGEDAIRIPRGTTAQRPTTLGLGQIRYNTQLHTFEGYGAGNAWGSLGGIKDVDRDTYITAENSAGADNDELRFYTAQFEENVTPATVPRMIIKNDGDIGINTISPTHKLHVNGTLGVEDAVALSSTLDITGVTNINNNLGVTGNTTIESDVGISGATTIGSTINISGNATFDSTINRITFKDKTYIEGKDSDYVKVITNNSERLMITKNGNIGIGKSAPSAKLDVNGTLNAVGSTTLQSTLNVTAATSLENSLSVTGITTLDNTLNVSGATTIDDTITINGASTLNNTLQVSGATTLNSTLSVLGISQFSSDLTTIGKISARHTTNNVGVEITPFGGNSATNGGGRVFFRENDNSNTYGFSLGFNGGEGLEPTNLTWPTNTFCISRHNGNTAGEVVLAIERGSNNVGLGTGIPDSNLHLKQTNGANDCMIKIESDGGNGSNKPNAGIEFVTNDGNPTTPSSSEPTYTSSKILSGWNQGEGNWNESFFKIQTHHQDATLNDSFTIKGPNVGINNNSPQFTLDIDGTLNTTGATTINNTLNTTGATTLGSSLGVTGQTTLGNTLGVTGSSTLGSTLAVTGATTLNNTLSVTGAATLSSTLGVTGATTLGNTLGVSGNTTVGGKLGIGTTSPSDILTISSNSDNTLRIEKLTSGGKNEIDFRTPSTPGTGNTFSSAKIVAFDTRAQGGNGSWHSKLGFNTSKHGVSSEKLTIDYEGNIGIKNTSPNVSLDITGNDAIRIPIGTTIQRPTTQELGQIRYNTELDTYEGYGAGNAWGSLGGVKDVDRDTFISAQDNANADNDELKFFTAQSEDTITATTVPRMIIKNDGKIGLNNISPSHLLHVNGTSRLGDGNGQGAATYFGTGNFYIHHGSSATYNGTFSAIQGVARNVVMESNQNIFVKSSLNNIIGNTIIGLKDTTTDQLHVEGSTNITGATNLESTLDVAGASILSNTLEVTGITTLNSNLSVGSQTVLNGNAETLVLKGSGATPHTYIGLYPDGTTNRKGYFGFGGHTLETIAIVNEYANGNIKLGNNTNITGTLDVTGATTLPSLDVTGNSQLNTVDVSGATQLGDTLDVSGATTINNTLSVGDSLFIESNTSKEPIATFKTTGVTDCSIKIESQGESYIELANVHTTTGDSNKSWGIGTNDDKNLHFNYKNNGTINNAANDAMTILSDGKVGIGNNNPNHTLDVDGGVNISGDCFIGGDLQFAGEVEMSNSLAITGDSNFDGDLTISGHGDFNGNLDVALATTLNSTLSVTGITTLKNDLNINNNNTNKFSVDSSTGNVDSQGTLNVVGSTTLSDTLGVTGATTLSNTLAVTGNTTVGGKLGIGTTSPSQILTVSSNTNNTIRIEKLTSGGQNEIDFRALGSNGETWSSAKIVAVDTRAQGAGGSWHSKLGFFTSAHGSSTEQMVIDYLGNVGIGTQPASKLHIKGSVNSSHFYHGSDEDIYIRGGKSTGDIFLNGDTSGKVGIGNNNPQHKLDITGTMRTTGATTLSDTLGVTGATTLGNTLDVTGAATLTDTLSVAGHTELTSTVTIKGAHDVVLKLEADTGNPNTTESEDWNPLIHLSQDKGAINTYFGMVGNVNTGMNPSVANYAYINSNQGIHLGRNGVPSLTVGSNSNVHIGGSNNVTEKLRVTGTFKATDDSTIGGTLDVTGMTTLDSSLSVASQATFNGNAETIVLKGSGATPHTYIGFYPDGTSNRKGYFGFGGHNNENISLVNQYTNGKIIIGNTTDIGGGLNVTGATVLSQSLTTSGNFNVNSKFNVVSASGNTTISGTTNSQGKLTAGLATGTSLQVEGEALLKKKLTVNLSSGLGLDVKSNANIDGTLQVDGATTIGSTLNVTGNSNFGGLVVGNLRQKGAQTDNYIEYYQGNTRQAWVGYSGNSNFNITNQQGSTVAVNNDLIVTGSTTLQDTLTVSENTTLSKDLTVSGDSTITGDLTVNGSELRVNGNLFVSGTTTTINTTNLTIQDKDITLASNATNNASANGAGFIIEAGSDTDKQFTYSSTGDKFTTNIPLQVEDVLIYGKSNEYAYFKKNSGAGFLKMWEEIYLNSPTSDIYFQTGGANRMFIKNNGNIGIGTTAPLSKLHVNGGNITITEGSSNNNGSIKIIPSAPIGNGDSGGRIFFQESGNYGFSLGYNGGNNNSILNWPSNTFCIASHNNNANGVVHVAITRSDGKVGIGTTSPSQKLHVVGSQFISNALHFEAADEDKILFADHTDKSKISHSTGWSVDYHAGNKDSQSGIHRFMTSNGANWVERMRITSTGSLHIGGATDPAEKLKVSGNTFITGITTIGNQLHVRGNDICLGANAGSGSRRAIVSANSNTQLILNYSNDFTNGVQIGGDDDNSPSSSLNVTGATTIGSTLSVTGATTLGSTLSVSGITTLGSQLHVRGNDIALGANAGSTSGRAIVKKDNTLIINYQNDFSGGVKIGGDSDNSPASNLVVTGNTTIDSELYVGSKNKINTLSGYAYYQSTNTDSAYVSLANDLYLNSKTSDITFETGANSHRRMIIKNDGKVGIGNTSPSYKLDVNGNLRVQGNNAYNFLQGHLQVADNLDDAHFRFGSATSSTNGGSPIALLRSPSTTNPALVINYNSQFPAGTEIDSNTKIDGNLEVTGSLMGSGFDALVGSLFNNIHESGSNVGIGTDTPLSNLHIKQINGSSDCMIKIEADGGNNSNKPNTGIEFLTNDGNPSTPTSSQPVYTSSKILSGWNPTEGSYDQSFFKIQTHHTDSTTLNDSFTIKGQNVGINNNTPQNTLDVDGTLNITGTATLGSDSGDNLLIKCNDVSLGPNAAVGAARAMVAYNSGSELVLNWGNDFTSGVRIGNPANGETSHLNVTGNLKVGQGIVTTDNTHNNSYAHIYKNAHGYGVFSNTRVASNPASISMGAEMYITTPTSSMFFNTGVAPNNTTKMFIAHAGNVGIGTTDPGKKLHVNGTFKASDNSDIGGTLDVTGAATLSSTLTVTGATTLGNTLGVSGNTTVGGKLGIGTTNPICKQSINYTGTETYNFGLEIDNQSLSGDASNRHNHILFTDGNSTQASIGGYRRAHSADYRGGLSFMTADDLNNSSFGHPTSTSMAAGALTERMRITPGGNVGIGILEPTHKLDVNGTFRASGATTLESTLSVGGTTTLGDQLHVKGNDICLGPNAQGGQARALVCSTSGNGKLIINYDGDFPDGVLIESNTKIEGNLELSGNLTVNGSTVGGGSSLNNIHESGSNVGIGNTDPQHKLDVDGTFRATGATTLSSTLSVASDVKVDGNLLLQGGKKFHIGRNANDTPNASDDATVLISGATNSGPPGTLGTLFKIDNYNNDSNNAGIPNQKVIIYKNENGHEDYYFKSSRDATDAQETKGFHYYRGQIAIGTESFDSTLTVDGTISSRVGDLDCGIKIIPQGVTGGSTNAGGRIFFKEDSGSNDMGFSLAYNGGTTLTDIGNKLPSDTFGILRHYNDASGETVISIQRDTGKVGIGTTNPTSNLCIQSTGYTHISNHQHDTQLSIENSSNTTTAFNSKMGIGVMDNGKGTIQVLKAFDPAGYKDLLLQPIDGNVGIGTDTPEKKLHVHGEFLVKNPAINQNMLHSHSTDDSGGSDGCTFLDIGWEGNYDPSQAGPVTAIRLGGRKGDQQFNHCVIENNVYQTLEGSELLLFKGNDVSGNDRIRLLSNEIRFDTFTTATNGIDDGFGTGRTDNTFNRLTIKQDGKIGIGNTNPQHKLDITGELRIGDSSAPEQGLHLLTNQGQWEVGTNNVGNNGSNNNQFYIYDNSNQGADYAVTVQRGTGDVGIGTKSPSKKLDVNGDTNINGELLVSDRVNAKNTIKTYTVDFSSVPNNKFAAVKISSGRLDFLEYYHEFFISSGGTVAGGYPNSNFIKVQASGGGYNDTGAHANVEYGLYNQGEWLMLAIYATDNANAQDVIVYLRGGHSSGNAQTGTIHSEAGKYSIHTMSGSVTGYATDSLSYPILNEQFAHNYTNVEDGGEMGDTHYIRKNQRLYNAREYINSAGTGIRPNMQFAVPHDSRPYKSALFDFEGSLRTRIGGILLQNNDGNFNPGHRKAVSSDVITNEIHGVGGGTDSHDVGFLRLSAGGGTGTHNKSYIDLYGYNSNIITLGTRGSERMVIDESGNVGIGTTSPSKKLDVSGTFRATSHSTIGGDLDITGQLRANSASAAVITSTDLSLGPGAAAGRNRALVSTGSADRLIINYANDFADGVIIGTAGGDSNLEVTGETKLNGNLLIEGGNKIHIGANNSNTPNASDDTIFLISGRHTSDANGSQAATNGVMFKIQGYNNDDTTQKVIRYASENQTTNGDDYYFKPIHTTANDGGFHYYKGSIGIGTESSDKKFRVDGTSRLGGDSSATWFGSGEFYIHHGSNTHLGTFSELKANDTRSISISSSKFISMESTDDLKIGRFGGPYLCHFNYGNTYDTYIRSGKGTGKVILQDTGGNVGIGTTSPDYKLDVRGNMRLGDGSTAQQALRFRTSEGDWQIGSNNYGNGTNDNQLFFYNVDDSQVHMCIQRGSGKVGIGTQSPVEKLDVRGRIFCESGINIDPDNNNILINTSRHINYQDNWTPVQITYSHQGNYGGNLFFNTHGNDGNNNNNVSTKMSILHNGNIGIGTDAPTSKLQLNSGGFTLMNNDDNFNPGHRKAISSSVLENEIHGVGGGTNDHDVGFLRLSAGGGTGTNNKSYIDLYGYNSNIITLGTAGTERMVIDESGNVGMGTEDPSGLLHMKSTGDVVLRMEADSDDVGESDNPVIHMSQDKNLCHFKIGMNGTNNGSGMTGSKDNYAYLNTQTDTQNYGLHLATENKVAMTIDERQFVGIGTNDPGSILHLRGSNPTLRIQRDTYIGSEESIISFRNSEFDEALIKSSTPNTSTGNVYRGHLSFYTRLHTGGSPGMVRAMHITDPISASVGGRVGINTNNPVVQLDVKGECRVEQLSSTTSFFEGHESGGGRFGFSFGVVGGHSDKNVHIDMHDNITNTYRSVGFFENSSGSEGGNTQTVINDFTGQHRCISINNISADHYGLIVFSTGNYLNTDNTINPTINDSLPICKLADTNNDQRVLGVISNSKDDNDDRVIGYGLLKTIQQKANKNETRIHINSVGEGGIWVCNKNGNISNGDYITTCSIPGYGAKQSDNILYNYSVAKITCDCDFKINRQTKMRVKVRNVVTTKQVPETTTKEKTTTEFKIEYNEELQKHIRREIVKTVSEEVNVMEEVDLYDEQGNLIYDEEGNTIKHSVQKMKTIEENRTELVYDENGNIQYEKDITEDGEEQFEFEYDTRFLLPDGTLIPNKEEYITRLNNGEEVYIACFVGCSYHCG